VRRQLLLSSPGSAVSEDADDHLGAFDLPRASRAAAPASSWLWGASAGSPKHPSHITPTSVLEFDALGSYTNLSPASSQGSLVDIPLTASSSGKPRTFGASDVHRAAMAAASETERKNAASRGCSLFGGCGPLASAAEKSSTPDPSVRHLRFLSQPPPSGQRAPSSGKPPRSRLCSLL